MINILPWKALHKLRDITDIMHNTSVEIIEGKKKALEQGDEAVSRQVGQGKDIISILSSSCKSCFILPNFVSVRANMSASDEDRLSDKELLGQV